MIRWLAAALVAVVLVEALRKLLAHPGWSRSARALQQALADFRAATHDDQRQAALMRSGFAALGLGLAALALVGAAAALLVAVPWAAGFGVTGFALAVSAWALAWAALRGWLTRRGRR